jgi:hypothetical protein
MTVWAQSQAARMVREAIADEERRLAARRAGARGGRRAEDMVEVSQSGSCLDATAVAPAQHVPETT